MSKDKTQQVDSNLRILRWCREGSDWTSVAIALYLGPMSSPIERPSGEDKPLFTPGPLTTSSTVKQAMQRDLGSRDTAFIESVQRVRDGLLRIAGVSQEAGWECVPMQGSGTFGVEAALGSAAPRDGRLLVLANGAYGERVLAMARAMGIKGVVLRWPEDVPVSPERVARELPPGRTPVTVVLVHCETTTGIVNPVAPIGEICRAGGHTLLLDAMSSFGALPLDLDEAGVDWLVSSANKCIEGVPGFSFALARRERLEAAQGNARSLSLDLVAQWQGLEKNGQFRFTPPTHALLAFERALDELEAEGGPSARLARYGANQARLLEGMRALGFETYLEPDQLSPIITSFRCPEHEAFSFEALYDGLNERGYVIYPGKVSDADCFRIGTIGRLFPEDVEALLGAVDATLVAMGVELGASQDA